MATRKVMPARKDFGAPTDPYYARQAADQRVLLEKLRAIVLKVLPDAESSIKWGVPFYARNGKSVCSIAAFKEHVGINFFAPPSVLADPGKKLEGGGKSMRMLKVRTEKDIDTASITRWLKATVAQNDKENEMPPKSKPSPSRSGRGTNPPGGGYGKGGKKGNPAKPKPGRAK